VLARSISRAFGLTFPTSFFPGSLGASAIIAGTAVEYVGSMAPVPEITVSDWQIAVACLMHRNPRASFSHVGRVGTFSESPS
jgi:hypothetical protein